MHAIFPSLSRRSFMKASIALAASASVIARPLKGQAPLMAYVGTFSSPLRNTLPTQVDLPPGNGRGIHSFLVDRSTGALTAGDVYEFGNSPNCLVIDAAG